MNWDDMRCCSIKNAIWMVLINILPRLIKEKNKNKKMIMPVLEFVDSYRLLP